MIGPYRVLALLAALAACHGIASAGDPLSECRPLDLATGEALDLEDYAGKVLYVDFWASWCAPCRKTFPFMNALHDELAAAGLRIVAISVDEERADARRFLERFPADFQVAIDGTGACPIAFDVVGMPSSYILGRDGALIYGHAGFSGDDSGELRARVLEALE